MLRGHLQNVTQQASNPDASSIAILQSHLGAIDTVSRLLSAFGAGSEKALALAAQQQQQQQQLAIGLSMQHEMYATLFPHFFRNTSSTNPFCAALL
jgi:hypothetical protein